MLYAGMKGKASVTERGNKYAKGDWIVHPVYGVGVIRRIERKQISGEKMKYYRVEADDTTYWVPVENVEDSRVRKVLSRSGFRKAVRLLKNEPRKMDPNYKKRQNRIREVLSKGSLRPMVRLVRDLWARDRRKALNDTEKAALRQSIQTLVGEWAVAEGISPEEASAELDRLLESSLAGQTQEEEPTESHEDPS
jgi:CarD family transcriptional regulator